MLDARSLKVSRRKGDAKVKQATAVLGVSNELPVGVGKLMRSIDDLQEARHFLRSREPTPDPKIIETVRAEFCSNLPSLFTLRAHKILLKSKPTTLCSCDVPFDAAHCFYRLE